MKKLKTWKVRFILIISRNEFPEQTNKILVIALRTELCISKYSVGMACRSRVAGHLLWAYALVLLLAMWHQFL